MKIPDEYLVLTKKGNVSWRKTAERLMAEIEKNERVEPSGKLCPHCLDEDRETELVNTDTEIWCPHEGCRFGKIYAEVAWIERFDQLVSVD